MSETAKRTIQHYELQEIVGMGGMGDVHKGLDTRTGQPVAIKRLKMFGSDIENQLERFRREGEMLRQLDHPNIVQMLETVEHEGQYFIIMEFVSGGSLREIIERGEQLTVERVVSLGLDIADALTRVHRLNIIHRDLKPANVLLANDGSARLTDFGIAHLATLPSVTQSGAIVGTAQYLSPEALNGEPLDARVDIWAFGVLLFEMLGGIHPFEAGPTASMLRAILLAPPTDLEALRPDAPIELIDLIYRMLDKDPQARISTVRLVGAQLEIIATYLREQAAREKSKYGGEPTALTPSSRIKSLSIFAQPTPTPEVAKHNLPAQTTPFIGREGELTELARLLDDPGVRLITILGPGGMGKTRLSLEAGERHLDSVKHGVYFVPLAAYTDPDNILPAIAEAVRFEFYPGGAPQQQLLDFLREKEMLLVLDNFEQIVSGAPIVTQLLEAAPKLTVLASSRERLNLSGETIFALGGIDFPEWETPDDALEYTAVKLFLASARRVWPGFELNAEDLPYVARICRYVVGVPLGIVLAAAWVDMLSPKEIADEIEHSLDFLETELRDVPERHRSIRAVYASSWLRLEEAEQEVFLKLSVFRGGFTRQAGQGVTDVSLRQLMALVNKSLIRRDPDSGRYEVHELLRQYAALELDKRGDNDAVRDAHSAYYLDALAGRETALKGRREVEARDDIESDSENVRAAWFWAVERAQWSAIQRAAETLWRFYQAQSRRPAGRAAFQAVVDALDKPEVISAGGQQAMILGGALYRLASFTDDQDTVLQLLQRSLDLLREHGQPVQLAWPLMALAVASVQRGELDRARELYQESHTLAELYSDHWTLAWVNRNRGVLEGWIRGDTEAGERYMGAALETFRALGLQTGIANTLYALGAMAHTRGDRADTLRLNEEALAIFRDTRSRMGEAIVLCALGWEVYMLEEYVQSHQYLTESLAIRRELGDKGLVPHINLSYTTLALGNVEDARDHTVQALKILAETRVSAFALYVLVTAAMLLARKERASRAVELLALALEHPALEPDCKQVAEPVRAELEQKLGADAYSAAYERGQALDLTETVKALVSEL